MPGKNNPPTRDRGTQVEQIVHQYLRRRGLRPVSRNYNCKAGEIDLIMLDGDRLIFIEVRYRRSLCYGHGFDTVTRAKRRRIVRTAQHFLLTRPHYAACAMRFDLVGVHGDLAGQPRIDWLTNAFTMDDI